MEDLLVAAEQGDIFTVANILDTQAVNLNELDVEGYTVLHYACSGGDPEVVKYLLSKGADANAINSTKGQTPLHCACNGGHLGVVDILLKRPEVINTVNSVTKKTNSSPMHCTAFSGKPDAGKITAMLLSKGALVDPRDANGNTPLLFAVKKGNLPTVEVLLRSGANPNVEDGQSDTPILIACALGFPGIVKALLKAGVSAQGQPFKGKSLPPLHLAARGGFLDVCKELVAAGVRIDAPSRLGRSALHLAAVGGFAHVVQFFISQRASLDAVDEDHFTPLTYAAQRGHTDVIDTLLKAGADPNVPVSEHGWTSLHYAAMENIQPVITHLLECPRTNVNLVDKEGRSALHWAAFNGEMGIVLALLERGADAALQDSGKRTPGVIAAAKGFEEMAELLHRKAGADPVAMSKKRISSNTLSSYWVMNNASQGCMGCTKKFTFTNRRHHCRECRKLFCNACSSSRLPAGHRLAGLRVCNDCYERELRRPRTNSSASLAPLALHHPSKQQAQHQHQQSPHEGAQRQQQPAAGHKRASEEVHFPEIAYNPALNTAYLEEQLERHQKEVERHEEDDNRLYMQEFQSFSNIGKKSTVKAAKENPDLNRYKDILAYDHSRVVLSHGLQRGSGDYINASYLDGYKQQRRYIACQGPLPHTVSAFWQMVWEQKATVIVMLACLREGRSVKCHQYWPEIKDDQSPVEAVYGDYSVTIIKDKNEGSYVHRRFKIHFSGEESREIDQFHFILWPDHDAPQTPDDVLSTHKAYREALKKATVPSAPAIVHCSAGVGRSGAFITLDRAYDTLCDGKEKELDIPAIVRDLRESRNYMVQSLSQYIFVFNAVTQMLQRLIIASLPLNRRPQTLEEAGSHFSQDDAEDEMINMALSKSRLEESHPGEFLDVLQEEEDEEMQLAMALSLSESHSHDSETGADMDVSLPQIFHVQYLGSQRIHNRGDTRSAFGALQAVRSRGGKGRPVQLYISIAGVEIIESGHERGALFGFETISYCQSAPNKRPVVCMVVHSSSEFICHIFSSRMLKDSIHVTLCVRAAFSVFVTGGSAPQASSSQPMSGAPSSKTSSAASPALSRASLHTPASSHTSQTVSRQASSGIPQHHRAAHSKDDEVAIALALSREQSEAQLREQEEIQLALALSQSESHGAAHKDTEPCPRCNNPVLKSAEFCDECGGRISTLREKKARAEAARKGQPLQGDKAKRGSHSPSGDDHPHHLADSNPFLHPDAPLKKTSAASSSTQSPQPAEDGTQSQPRPKLPFRILSDPSLNPVETHGIVGTAKHTADELKNNPFLFFDDKPSQKPAQADAHTPKRDYNPFDSAATPSSPLLGERVGLNMSSSELLEEGDRLVQDAKERVRAALGGTEPKSPSPMLGGAPSSPALSVWAQAGKSESMPKSAERS